MDYFTLNLRDAYKELLNQLSLKIEKLTHHKSLVLRDFNSLNEVLEEFDKSHERSKQAIEDYFHQLREILNYKEKELKLSIEHNYTKKISSVKNEVKHTELLLSNYDSLMDLIRFSMSFQNNVFVEGIEFNIS